MPHKTVIFREAQLSGNFPCIQAEDKLERNRQGCIFGASDARLVGRLVGKAIYLIADYNVNA